MRLSSQETPLYNDACNRRFGLGFEFLNRFVKVVL